MDSPLASLWSSLEEQIGIALGLVLSFMFRSSMIESINCGWVNHDCQHEEEADGLPHYNWSTGFPVIDAPLLLPTMYVELCLPFVDFTCVDPSLALHSPHHVQYSCPFQHFFSGDYLPVFASYAILQLLVHGPFELVSIGRLHCFMKVHDVWICTRHVHHGLLHMFLYLILPLGCWYVFCFALTDEDFQRDYPLLSLIQPFGVTCCVAHYPTTAGLSLLFRVFHGCG